MPPTPFFAKETLSFLAGLKRNNNREWFAAHKAIYESAVKAPVLAFASALSEQIATVAPSYATAAEKAVQRIYRDIRFSPDKTPYRTELGILFVHRDLGKKQGAGLYISLSSEEVTVAGGVYQQDTAGLHAIRQHLVNHADAYRKVTGSRKLRESFGTVTGAALKRPPRGVPVDHPLSEELKRTQWLLECKLLAESATTAAFLPEVFKKVELLLPFVQFFEPPLLQKLRPVILE